MEAHIIVSKHIFPYLVLGRGPMRSTITLLTDSSTAGMSRSGATRMVWFAFPLTWQVLQDLQSSATSRLSFGQ